MIIRKIISALAVSILSTVMVLPLSGADEIESVDVVSSEDPESQGVIDESLTPIPESLGSDNETYSNQEEIYAVTVPDEASALIQGRASASLCTSTRKISCGVYSASIQYFHRQTNQLVGTRNVIVNTKLQMQARSTRVSASTYLIVTSETGAPPPGDSVEVRYNRTAPGTSVSYPATKESLLIPLPPPGSNVSAPTQPTISVPNTALGAEGHMVGISFKSLMETSEKTFSPQSPVRCAYITTNVQNCVNSSIMPVVTFSSARVPTIVSNISTAFNQGHPSILTKNTHDAADSNRDMVCPQSQLKRLEALGPKPTGMLRPSCDEYSFASSDEGGSGARVQWVPQDENNSQGGTLSSFYINNQVAPGDKFKVEVS